MMASITVSMILKTDTRLMESNTIVIEERRVVYQEWYETEFTKTGWDSHGWMFDDGRDVFLEGWEVVLVVQSDKHGNPTIGVAENVAMIIKPID